MPNDLQTLTVNVDRVEGAPPPILRFEDCSNKGGLMAPFAFQAQNCTINIHQVNGAPSSTLNWPKAVAALAALGHAAHQVAPMLKPLLMIFAGAPG